MNEKNREVEWQFDVKNLEHIKGLLSKFFSGLPYAVHHKKATLQRDSYFDTDDFMFYHAGFSLRIRHKDSSFEASLKSLSDVENRAKNGPRSRIELTENVGGESANYLLAKKRGEITRLIRSKHPKSKLEKLFSLEVEREVLDVFLDRKPLVEIALDRGKQVADPDRKKPLNILRLEIEVKNPSMVTEATHLVNRLKKYLARHDPSFKRAHDAKFVLAMRHNALRGARPQFGDAEFNKNLPIERYIVEIFKKYLTRAFMHEAGCRLGFDVESVHHMRVALRKILSAMKVFADFLPAKLLTFRSSIKNLISSLGKVRDFDVEMASLRESTLKNYGNGDGIDEIIEFLTTKRDKAHKQLLRTMNGQNYGQMVNDLQILLNSDDTVQETSFPADEVYKTLIKKRMDSFEKRGRKLDPSSKPKRFHKLRIEGKMLRYALEFFLPLHEKKIGKMVELMSSIQNKLGLINDCRVAKDKLLDITTNKIGHFSALAFYKMGQASMHYVVTEKKNRRQFIEQFNEIDWGGLRRSI